MLTRPARLLRVEEAGLLTATVVLYSHFHFSRLLFAVLFLAPDLSTLGYLLNPRFGAPIYNLGHNLTIPLVLFFHRLQRTSAIPTRDIHHLQLSRTFTKRRW